MALGKTLGVYELAPKASPETIEWIEPEWAIRNKN